MEMLAVPPPSANLGRGLMTIVLHHRAIGIHVKTTPCRCSKARRYGIHDPAIAGRFVEADRAPR
jgi:hypothetical protein